MITHLVWEPLQTKPLTLIVVSQPFFKGAFGWWTSYWVDWCTFSLVGTLRMQRYISQHGVLAAFVLCSVLAKLHRHRDKISKPSLSCTQLLIWISFKGSVFENSVITQGWWLPAAFKNLRFQSKTCFAKQQGPHTSLIIYSHCHTFMNKEFLYMQSKEWDRCSSIDSERCTVNNLETILRSPLLVIQLSSKSFTFRVGVLTLWKHMEMNPTSFFSAS